MMAHNSKMDGPSLPTESLAELTSVLDTFVRDQGTERLQLGLQRIAMDARERRMHAEQLLAALKDTWYALPALQQATGEEQNRMLQRVVSACIREYYGG